MSLLPCGCSAEDEDDGYGVVCAEHAPYPTDEVWAGAKRLAAYDRITDFDGQEDEVQAYYYGVAEDVLLAAQEVRAARAEPAPAESQEQEPGGDA
jgi:hypothetical protein